MCISDRLYYVRVGLDGRNGIYALELAGGAPEPLIEGEFGGLQLSNGRLYYLNAEHKLYSCALDGSDAREVMGFDAYYAYMLDDDWLLYQSDEDEETLHAYRLSDGLSLIHICLGRAAWAAHAWRDENRRHGIWARNLNKCCLLYTSRCV